jgi:prepilin peptidase dependent protein B
MRQHTQRGMTLIELMVGLALGLVVMAGAATALADQIQHSQRAVLQARLQQDLRAAAVLIERELRLAGHWPQALQHTSTPAQANPYGAFDIAADHRSVHYHHGGSGNSAAEALGFRLVQQTLQSRLGAGGWQSLTERQTLQVTELRFEPHVETVEATHACAAGCADGRCPQLQLRSVRYTLAARATTRQADVRHTLQGQVQLRNDAATPARCL